MLCIVAFTATGLTGLTLESLVIPGGASDRESRETVRHIAHERQ